MQKSGHWKLGALTSWICSVELDLILEGNAHLYIYNASGAAKMAPCYFQLE